MISRRNAILAAITGLAGIGATQVAFAKGSSPVALFDTDNDGTVDLAEAKKAASDLFDKLDHDKDGTLDIKDALPALSGFAQLANQNLPPEVENNLRPLRSALLFGSSEATVGPLSLIRSGTR